MKKSISKGIVLSAVSFLGVFAGSQVASADTDVAIAKTSIVVKGYEFGPAVPKVVVKLDSKVSKVSKENVTVTTAGTERQVSKVYLSDKNGKKVTKDSKYVTIQMPVTFDTESNSGVASPFFYNMENFHNTWVDDYTVSIQGLTVTVNGEESELDSESNAINNRISTDVAAFSNRGSYSGTYTNPLTNQDEELTLQYAAYEPESLKNGKKNPLIIWLHGQGEGGTDTDITLLGNEVVALAKDDIQSHFTAGKQTGAYVLAVQTPTYWMDEGDGTNGAGAGVSRYTEVLMDTIKDYVSNHSDVDTDRIYLTGGSNGGYMTLNLAINNPDYFAALVPQAAAYSYYQYQRNEDGTYTTVPSDTSLSGTAFVKTDDIYFDEDKIAALKDIPIWFIHAANDTVVNPSDYSLPIYKALVDSGATNKWFSYYESVEGSDMKDTSYLGHWSWTYFFNDKVSGVQSVSDIKEADDLSGFSPNNKTNGGTSTAKVDGTAYDNIFDWLNAQKK